jgi:DEAD/DEAH box helicase domain-containing protein
MPFPTPVGPALFPAYDELVSVVRDIEPWDALLEAGRADERLVMMAAENRRPPRAAAVPDDLHADVAAALAARGVEQLWSHQVEALHAAWAGPTIVTTGTASGKSLCFNLPTLDVLCRDARGRARDH